MSGSKPDSCPECGKPRRRPHGLLALVEIMTRFNEALRAHGAQIEAEEKP